MFRSDLENLSAEPKPFSGQTHAHVTIRIIYVATWHTNRSEHKADIFPYEIE